MNHRRLKARKYFEMSRDAKKVSELTEVAIHSVLQFIDIVKAGSGLLTAFKRENDEVNVSGNCGQPGGILVADSVAGDADYGFRLRASVLRSDKVVLVPAVCSLVVRASHEQPQTSSDLMHFLVLAPTDFERTGIDVLFKKYYTSADDVTFRSSAFGLRHTPTFSHRMNGTYTANRPPRHAGKPLQTIWSAQT